MNQMFLELTGILLVAGVIAYILHFLKQPSIIAYIITGLLIGPFSLYRLQHGEVLHSLSEIGITLLLFMVGLDLDISQLKKIGKTAVIAGVGQIVFTCAIGFVITTLLGFAILPAIYIALALTFSSTIIVVKLLSEKKDMQSLYGKLAVGIFLVQDIVAILVLILVGGINNHSAFLNTGFIYGNIIISLAKAFMLGVIIIFLSRKVFPKLIRSLVKSDEMLLLFSLGWSLGLAALFSSPLVGFNAAIGGFVAGLALANTGAHYQVSGRIKPLRDFFIIIFFIVLGTQLVFSHIGAALVPALVLTVFVLIGNPLIVTIILGLLGYKLRTSFMTGITVAQISEFSLILMTLGLAAGHVDETHVTIVTLVGISTIAISSYGILFSNKLYEIVISKIAHLVERKVTHSNRELGDVIYKQHIVIVGAHRLGSHLMHSLKKNKEQFLLVDFNPDVVSHFQKEGIAAVCGDIADPYIQDVASLIDAKMIVCTIPDFHDTLALLEAVRVTYRKRTRIIVAAADEQEALELYAKGADYVLLPHFVGSMHLLEVVEHNSDPKKLHKLRDKHLKTLHKALAL
ncbi:MAG TPA: cation:proton antiporter [Patescibacteria group bacterium]|jgi:Kef-type K+ transport system membrane component KefB|nr:cation:proton antiporter [Patescibacteria group bacterium]